MRKWIIVLLLLSIIGFSTASDYNFGLTYSIADLRYCRQNGNCNLSSLTVINVTQTNLNLTGNINMNGNNITNGGYFFGQWNGSSSYYTQIQSNSRYLYLDGSNANNDIDISPYTLSSGALAVTGGVNFFAVAGCQVLSTQAVTGMLQCSSFPDLSSYATHTNVNGNRTLVQGNIDTNFSYLNNKIVGLGNYSADRNNIAFKNQSEIFIGDITMNKTISRYFIEKDIFGEYYFDDNATDYNNEINSFNQPTTNNGRLTSYMNMTQFVPQYLTMKNISISVDWQGIDTTNSGTLLFALKEQTDDPLTNTDYGFYLWMGDQSTGGIVINIYNGSTTPILYWRSTTDYNNFAWNHMVFLCGETGMKVYVNNNEIKGTFTKGNANIPCGFAKLNSSANVATINGAQVNNNILYTARQYFDNLKIYNRTLTLPEIYRTQDKNRHSPNIYQLNNLGSIGFQGSAQSNTFLRMFPTAINGNPMQQIFNYRTSGDLRLNNEFASTGYNYMTLWTKEYIGNMHHLDLQMTDWSGTGTTYPVSISTNFFQEDYPTTEFKAMYIEANPNSVPASYMQYTNAIDVGYGNIKFADYYGITFGTGRDSYITYDGTNMLIKPNNVGVGSLVISGSANVTMNLTVSKNLYMSNASAWSGYIVCYMPDTSLGHCTGLVAIGGTCTCSAN